MITPRDREIINFIYEVGFITIEQCGKLFFGENKTYYTCARKRLKKILDTKSYLKTMYNKEMNTLVYVPIDSKVKTITKHSILCLDYVIALKDLGVVLEVTDFTRSYGKAIPDAFIQFTFNGYRYYQLLEMQLAHYYVDVDKYKEVMKDIYKDTNNTIPTLVVVHNCKKDYESEVVDGMNVVHLRLDLEGLVKVLL